MAETVVIVRGARREPVRGRRNETLPGRYDDDMPSPGERRGMAGI
jgi:hypothetical protein